MHIMIGHLCLFSNMKSLWSAPVAADTSFEGCFTGTIALMGGGSMGLFYIISGFLMMVGYAQLPLRQPQTCGEILRRCCRRGGSRQEGCDDESLPVLDTKSFLRKRVARLAPMYYLTNLIGLVILALLCPLQEVVVPAARTERLAVMQA